MKNNWIKSLVFSFAILFCIIPTVNAATIIETTTEDAYDTIENNSIIVGVTKFESGEVLTAGKVALATYNYMLVNSGETNIEVPKIYYYLEDAWYEIDDENDTTLLEDTSLVDELDIYFVNNEEKMLEIPVKYTLKEGKTLAFESDNNSKDAEIKYENEIIHVPASVNEVKVLLKDINTSEELEIETWTKEHKNDTTFVSSALTYAPTLEKLQATYEFDYYNSIESAFKSLTDGSGEASNTDKENGSVGIYTDEDGKLNVVLLEDVSIDTRITPTVNMTINLGGNTLICTEKIAIDTDKTSPANIIIDARLDGSGIEVSSGVVGNTARAIQAKTGSSVTVLGGTYIGSSNGANGSTIYAASGASITVKDATVIANETNGQTRGFSISSGATANISNCVIIGDVKSGDSNSKGYGIYNSGMTTVSDCEIKAYSNYDTANSVLSQGILNVGEITVNNCYVMGTHSGIQNAGTLTVSGGTYESYGHGGIYFSGNNTISYVEDAIIRACEMPEGYTNVDIRGNAGLYVGGSSNMSIYIDNSSIYGSYQSIAMRGGTGEENNNVYISNSDVNLDATLGIRIDSDTHKFYSGVNNNFTAENTTCPEVFVQTNETYRKAEISN